MVDPAPMVKPISYSWLIPDDLCRQFDDAFDAAKSAWLRNCGDPAEISLLNSTTRIGFSIATLGDVLHSNEGRGLLP